LTVAFVGTRSASTVTAPDDAIVPRALDGSTAAGLREVAPKPPR